MSNTFSGLIGPAALIYQQIKVMPSHNNYMSLAFQVLKNKIHIVVSKTNKTEAHEN